MGPSLPSAVALLLAGTRYLDVGAGPRCLSVVAIISATGVGIAAPMSLGTGPTDPAASPA